MRSLFRLLPLWCLLLRLSHPWTGLLWSRVASGIKWIHSRKRQKCSPLSKSYGLFHQLRVCCLLSALPLLLVTPPIARPFSVHPRPRLPVVPGPVANRVPGPVSFLVPVPSAVWFPSHRPSGSRSRRPFGSQSLRPSGSLLVLMLFRHWLQGLPGPVTRLVPEPVSGPVSRLVPEPVSGPVSCLVPGPVGPVGLGRFPSVPALAASGSLSRAWFHRPSGSRTPSSTLSASTTCSGSSWSRLDSRLSSSSWRLQNRSSSRSRPRSPARVQASFLTVIPFPVKPRLPLDSVPALYSSQCRTAGILLWWLLPTVVPIPIPILLCQRATVPSLGSVRTRIGLSCLCRILVGGSCLGSRLIGPIVRGLHLGGGMDLAMRMRTVRRTSPHWTCFL